MSWANLDDQLHAHPKVRRLQRIPFAGPEAFGIWTWCLSWCRAYAPNTGRVHVADVALDWNADGDHMADVFALLKTVGLVDGTDEPSEYVIHDWMDWQHDQHQRAGKARAASAVRDGDGRFATSALEPLANAGRPAGHATPHQSPPHHARTRATSQSGTGTLRETMAAMGLPTEVKP